MRTSILICLFLFCHFTILLPQVGDDGPNPLSEFFNVQTITVEDGVSSEKAACFLKDRKGFMWIGTSQGLNRYDGYNFRSFVHDEFDKNSLSADFITCLIEDRGGIIWIGTLNGGLNSFDPELEVFTHYPVGTLDPYELGQAAITALCEDAAGNIWFAAQEITITESVYKFNRQSSSIECIIYDTIHPGSPAAIHSHALLLDSDENMWMGTRDGFAMYDSTKRRMIKYKLDMYDNSTMSREATALFEDSQGIIWVGSFGGGVYRFDRNTSMISRHDQLPYNIAHRRFNSIIAIVEDNNRNLVIRTPRDLLYLNLQTNRLITWEQQPLYRKSNIDFFIRQGLYWDPSGMLWFSNPSGTRLQGCIYKLDLKNKHFHHISSDQLDLDGLQMNWISSIFQDTDYDIWVGGSGIGLIEIIPSQSPVQINHHPSIEGDREDLYLNNILAIHQDRNGVMWVGSRNEGVLNRLELSGEEMHLNRFYPEDKIFTPSPYGPGDEFIRITDLRATGGNSMRIYDDKDGNLWIGRGNGLFLFDRNKGKFCPYILDPLKHEYFDLPIITSIVEDDSACLWISTMHQGLFKIVPPFRIDHSGNASGKRTISYRYDQETLIDFGSLMLTSLCFPEINRDMDLWIGTMGGGLLGLKRFRTSQGEESEQIVRYSESEGLADNTVFGILEDDKGHLWLSTENGLSRFNPVKEEFNTYRETDGLPVHKFHWLSSHKGRDGTMFFGGNNGLLSFHPDSIADNPVVPPVVITDFKLFNKPVPMGTDSPLKKSITETSDLQLSFRENHLTFEFAALNYVSTASNRYRYRMEGLDEDWIDAGTQRMANYTSLKHGKYTFWVMGSNNDGVWNEEGASLNIVISPPPWLKWWAYIIYALLLMGMVLLYRRYLLNQTKLKSDLEVERIEKEKVQELDHMKSRFFANISHEFRTPLTLLLGPINDLQHKQDKLDDSERKLLGSMKRNTMRLQQLINQLLDLSKLDTGEVKLQLQKGDLSAFTRANVLSFLSLAETRKIDYIYDIPEDFHPVMFDADKVEKILTNLISNAFKFTSPGGEICVDLRFLYSGDTDEISSAEISVRDTGEGIPPEMIDKIFDRFFQVSSSDTREFEGTGIGLALTRELVDIYKGNIKVESDVGKGSHFIVNLPVSLEWFDEDEIVIIEPVLLSETNTDPVDLFESTPAEKEPHETRIKQRKKAKPVVLIVEDNSDLRDYISQHLLPDYLVREAANGRMGFEKAIKSIPDLVISDLMMPEMDGLELCRRLKEDERTCHIPLIMLTAKADRASKLKCLEKGADDYIIKPFDSEELKIKIKNLIVQRRKLHEQFNRNYFIDDRIAELQDADERFLQKVKDIIDQHISDPDFNAESFSRNLGLSRSQLHRKLKGLTDQSPGEFLQKLRLKHSLILLKKGYENIAQIAYQVGFSDSSYYARCFRKLYGVSPSEYANGERKPPAASE